ncbi:MAG: IS982 family transposase [Acidobacteria bacterium]|nr:MAG: IS982 family transposase [Acidobacteriota bacterium]
MENLLIEIYLFVCHVYDTSSATCYQRLSNNRVPEFTDQELITIWFFAHLEGCFEKKKMHRLILKYWLDWFPRLPSYQTFVLRLNRLEPTFQTFGACLFSHLAPRQMPELDHIVDSLPVMLARHGHSYRARVAREVADIGFCAAKKTRFHGVRLHCLAQRRINRLPLPAQVWLCAASHHDSQAFIRQQPELPVTELFGDLAYPTPAIISHLKQQQTRLIAPQKKPKGKELTEDENYYNRLVRRIRQPIESLFNWVQEKTGIQRASKVRSTEALMIHGWGKLAVAFFLLVFNY